jgi:5-methylcytosine-specific restriction protein A
MAVKRPCLTCGELCDASRCDKCRRQRKRDTYGSREYRALGRPSGQCQLRIKCNGAPATSWHHSLPLAKGGSHARSNMVPACIPCNSSVRDRA